MQSLVVVWLEMDLGEECAKVKTNKIGGGKELKPTFKKCKIMPGVRSVGFAFPCNISYIVIDLYLGNN